VKRQLRLASEYFTAMTREHVELIRNLNLPSGVDVKPLIEDDRNWAALSGVLEPIVAPGCRFTWVAWGQRLEREGLEGLREGWIDWFEPWESYVSEIEDVLDAGEAVVLLARDRGRRADSDAEVRMSPASVVCIVDDKVQWADFYADRDEALETLGLRPTG
jgi:hypothetical protein